MSSTFRNRSRRVDVLVVADGWPGLLVARSLKAQGISVGCLLVAPPVSRPLSDCAVSIGNGEWIETARRIFGEGLAGHLWSLSELNYDRMKAILDECGVQVHEQGTLWRLGEKEARAKGLVFSNQELLNSLVRSERVDGIDQIISLEEGGPFEVELIAKRGSEKLAATSSSVVMVSEWLAPSHFASLRDKIIPVTLGALSLESEQRFPFSLAIFNGGADFAIASPKRLTLGSYRNLFEDKAIGIHGKMDPATKEGLLSFFGPRGWIKAGVKTTEQLSIEAISCDGLPLVGAVSEGANLFCIAGFAARRQNFIAAIADCFAEGLSCSGKAPSLDVFSTKRF